MAAVNLTTLRARARERADMPVSGFVTDSATSIDAWINEGVQKLHEMCLKAFGEHYVETSVTFNTVKGTSDYTPWVGASIPMMLYGVDLTIAGFTFGLRPFNYPERNLYKNLSQIGTLGTVKPRYSFVDGASSTSPLLRLYPAPDGVYSCTVWFAPPAPLLVNGADTVNFSNGWERYIVVYTAIQMMMKEESDVRELRAELEKMERELEDIMQRRNVDQPHSVVDIESVEDDDVIRYI